MGEPASDQKPAATGDGEPARALTNFDRLRVHLKSEGLANALLDAWLAAGPSDAHTRLLKALEEYYEPEQGTDERATPSEN